MANIPDGSVLTEVDTGLEFVWHDKRWNKVRHPLNGLLAQLLAEAKQQNKLLGELLNQRGE